MFEDDLSFLYSDICVNVMFHGPLNVVHYASTWGGGYYFVVVGMCRWENENWPIHLPNFDSKLDPYI